MPLPVAWIEGGWIFSADDAQSGRYWINGEWVWGPVGSASHHTGFWIADGWIYGPLGAADVDTGFRIDGDWIWGPDAVLPFVKPRAQP